MPLPRNTELEAKVLAAWRPGDTQAKVAKRLKADASGVSRAIARLTAEGRWSHSGPARGGARPGAGRPMAAPPPPVSAASAPELAGSVPHGMLTVRLPWPLFQRFKTYCYQRRDESQAKVVERALAVYLDAKGG